MNDSMGGYVASEVVKLMLAKDVKVKGANVLMLGITFKENCPDVRNTRVVDVVQELESYGIKVTIYDPLASPEEVAHEYQLKTVKTKPEGKFEAVVLAVAHKEFLNTDLDSLKAENGIVYDVKGVLDQSEGRL